MEPGRELDALIAMKVMGFIPVGDHWERGPTWNRVLYKMDSWSPSRDIAAAWEVIEKVNCLGKYTSDFLLQRERRGVGPNSRVWFAWFRKDNCDQDIEFSAECETAPHAICLAALKAVGVEV